MRVAVAQFATSSNYKENLANCIRMINATATCQPLLIVLPEFCNTRLYYVDHNQAWQEALALEGAFLQSIAAQAMRHDCYIVINVTLRRDNSRDHQSGAIKSNISVTSCLFSPLGKLIQQEDKQTLTGLESVFFICASKIPQVVTTPFGKLGMLTGNDSITFEASRGLCLDGAQLLCNSINSFAIDQSHLHDPARACENKVFLATANKIGPLFNQVSQGELQARFVGSGQSQIVSPDGDVLAKLTSNEEGFVFADIDLAKSNSKFRPDGTELFKQRRPELYQKLTMPMKPTSQHEQLLDNNSKVPVTANVAIFATYKSNEQAIEDVCHYIENNLSDIIQLPELFFIADKTITEDAEQLALIARMSKQFINQASLVLRPFQYLCTSLVIQGKHQAVLISEQGLLATQQQLHFCQRYQWTSLGDGVNIIKLPLEQGSINVAMLTGDDANIPEIVKAVALKETHLLLVPFDIQQPCEVEYTLLSRAAEHRMCIVAASREKSFAKDFTSDTETNSRYNKNKVKAKKSTGLIVNLTTDPTLLPQWQARKFNGYVNPPLVTHQHGKITKAVIHPFAAVNKLMATDT